MRYHFNELAEIILNQECLVKDDVIIEQIATDSRLILSGNQTVFFALKTASGNGHAFLNEAYKKGVRHFIVEEADFFSDYSDCSIIKVQNSIRALQELAKYHRSQFQITVVAITGSNGKTIVKEWLSTLLSTSFNVVKSPKSYNSQIGVPLSVLQMNDKHEVAVFEAGISEPGEMSNLEEIIQPTHAIFTNLGAAHDAYFESREGKAKEKTILFKSATKVVSSAKWSGFLQNLTNVSFWGDQGEYGISIKKGSSKTNIHLEYNSKIIVADFPYTDEASIENATNALIMALELGAEESKVIKALQNLAPVAMRLELKEGNNNTFIISDYYNSDISGIAIALDFMQQQRVQLKKTVVLSDLQDSKESIEETVLQLNTLFKAHDIQRLFLIGNSFYAHAVRFELEAKTYRNTESFLADLSNHSFQNETILLKGQRKFQFEWIAERLQKKLHSTVLEIDLNAVRNNLSYFKSKLKPNTKVMVMVKALAYGAGSAEMARYLSYNQVDYLGVAFVDEGIELRKSGISIPIIVLNPSPESYDLMLDNNLEPEIYNWKSLNEIIQVSKKKQDSVPIHIKVDTGMRRLGFEPTEIPEVLRIIKEEKNVFIKSVFSHLATSDEPSQKEHTLNQIAVFNAVVKEIESNLDYPFDRHILNSAGIIAFPEVQHTMVRLGLGLYGITPFEKHQGALQPVSKLKTIVSQIKHIDQGDAVGYGRREIAKAPMKIATVPIGYADGLPRLVGNRTGHMFVAGQKAPIIGNVCMDMTMLDITGIEVQEGDEVEVFGPNIHPNELASWAQTISYEILTNISSRVKRVYVQD
jgi:alanine racemase